MGLALTSCVVPAASDVEAEVAGVAVTHDVLLALDGELGGVLAGDLIAATDEPQSNDPRAIGWLAHGEILSRHIKRCEFVVSPQLADRCAKHSRVLSEQFQFVEAQFFEHGDVQMWEHERMRPVGLDV